MLFVSTWFHYWLVEMLHLMWIGTGFPFLFVEEISLWSIPLIFLQLSFTYQLQLCTKPSVKLLFNQHWVCLRILNMSSRTWEERWAKYGVTRSNFWLMKCKRICLLTIDAWWMWPVKGSLLMVLCLAIERLCIRPAQRCFWWYNTH